jgi:hypothetical protein
VVIKAKKEKKFVTAFLIFLLAFLPAFWPLMHSHHSAE